MEEINDEQYFPNIQERITKRGLGFKPILESQIRAAQDKAKSAAEAARMLNVSYNTYKKYATLYGIFEDLLNPSCKGIVRKTNYHNRKFDVEDLANGKYMKYPMYKFKNKLFNSGIIPKICSSCEFSEERITDGKSPLLIDFIDGNLNNRNIENIRPLCYNCFFLLVGERNVKHWYAEHGYPDEAESLKNQ